MATAATPVRQPSSCECAGADILRRRRGSARSSSTSSSTESALAEHGHPSWLHQSVEVNMKNRSARRRRIECGIYEQPNGKYAVCVMVGGRPRFHTLDAATLKDARRQRAVLRVLGALGELPVSPRLTFAEVSGRWLAEFEAKVTVGARRERTLDLYRSELRLHLLPRLGRRRITAITPDAVVALMRQLQTTGLSPWSVKRILGVLSSVLSYARRRGYIGVHPFECLERDERPHPRQSNQRVLTRSELTHLVAACPRRYRALLVTGAYTGMRLSEVLALTWEDVDFAAGAVHVRHQLARGRHGVPPHRIPPKTRASVRQVPLLPRSPSCCRSTDADRPSQPRPTTCSRPRGGRRSSPQRLETRAAPSGRRRRS
ncbi:MAG: tyrosine-type recombinase/integrase [Gaiellaceae bacterium]